MNLNEIDIENINNLYQKNLEKYEKIKSQIRKNIKGRICHNRVVLLNILVESFDIKNYLEIGVHNGASMSYVVSQRKPINCYGIDLFENTQGHYIRDKIGFKKSIENIQKNNLSNSQIELIKGNSSDQKTILKLTEQLNGEKIDLLFIDGDHSYASVKSDFENYISFLNKNSLVVFDDYNKIWPGVVKFCNELIKNNKYFKAIGLFQGNEYIFLNNK